MNNVHYALISYEGVQSQEHVRSSEGNEKRFYKTTGPEFKTFKSLIRYKKIGNRSYNIKINSRVGSPVEPHVEDASCCIDMNNIYYDLILYDSIVRTDAMVWTGPEFQKNCRTENTERRLYDEIHINWVR